jgi:phosphoenolpyruvate carboxykinase (ATP)
MTHQRLVLQLKGSGIIPQSVYVNLSIPKLIEMAIMRKEGLLSSNGSLCVTTGKHTGRSPDDRYIVDDEVSHNTVNWGKINHLISEEMFEIIYEDVKQHIKGIDVFIFEGYVGADPDSQIPLKVITDKAWQCIFANNMFLEKDRTLESTSNNEFTVISLNDFREFPTINGKKSDAFIIINLKRRIVLIGGTSYAGEIKKAMFSVMNFILPENNIMPMHCSANVGRDHNVTVFFGLSGTGKTTLSTDPNRYLIGDDEHGWSEKGVFNFEGGCYAKCIDLKREKEPQIWHAIKFSSIMENVIIDDKTREPDFSDKTITENTRVSYPLSHIFNSMIPSMAGHPNVIIFLTADAFGVIPPVARLTPEGAMYHFMSGYTSKLAGTESGIKEPKEVFSECFGAPFIPRHTSVYAKMLGERITKHKTRVYLVNTGWIGGPYGVGKRIELKYTRSIVNSIIDGTIESYGVKKHEIFNLSMPKECRWVPSDILDPQNAWKDKKRYEEQAKKLAQLFIKNFEKFGDQPMEIVNAGPIQS